MSQINKLTKCVNMYICTNFNLIDVALPHLMR
nr:MAG TPA: hypothetical protein [Bacteriophage sp.]